MIENASTCLARAEHWFGDEKSPEDFSLFHVDMWLYGAQYSGGLPRTGTNGFNSEIGHMKIQMDPAGPNCLCGATGCLATTASIYGLLLRSDLLGHLSISAPTDLLPAYRDLVAAARRGESGVVTLFEDAGKSLGLAVANHINGFDPGTVLIRVSDADLMTLMRPALEQSILRNVFKPLGQRTLIHIGPPVEDWRWKGAAAHALEGTYLNLAARACI